MSDAPKFVHEQIFKKLQTDKFLIKAARKACQSQYYLTTKEKRLLAALANFFVCVSPLVVKWREDGIVTSWTEWPYAHAILLEHHIWSPFGGTFSAATHAAALEYIRKVIGDTPAVCMTTTLFYEKYLTPDGRRLKDFIDYRTDGLFGKRFAVIPSGVFFADHMMEVEQARRIDEDAQDEAIQRIREKKERHNSIQRAISMEVAEQRERVEAESTARLEALREEQEERAKNVKKAIAMETAEQRERVEADARAHLAALQEERKERENNREMVKKLEEEERERRMLLEGRDTPLSDERRRSLQMAHRLEEIARGEQMEAARERRLSREAQAITA